MQRKLISSSFVNGVTMAPGSTITTSQAQDLWAIFGDSNVQSLLSGFAAAGAPVGALTNSFSNAENLVGFMQQLYPAT